jgi:hypothetical protein
MIVMTSQARMICSAEMIDGFGFLPVGGTGKLTGGPQSGLQGQITTIINGDWGPFQGRYAYLATEIFTPYDDCKNTAWMPHEVVDFKAGLNCDEGTDSFCGCTTSWRGTEFCQTVWLAAPIEMVVVSLGSVFALAKAQD